jgi:hypothetical protein
MTTEDTLPAFPVDDVTLNLLEHALQARLSYDDEGAVVVEGAEMTVPALLDFLSGYDASKSVPVVDEDGYTVPDITEYVGGPLYSRDDVIAALIHEVRRLRADGPAS